MIVTVTGGSGKLGSLIAEQCPAGWQVSCMDRVRPKANVDHFRATDVTDLPSVMTALQGSNAVIHLAAIPNPYAASPEEVFRVNALGTYHVTLACEALGIHKIVFASSICYYGYLFRSAFVAPPYFPIDEDTPSHPEDSYSLSKRVGEDIMQAFVQRTGGAVASLRFCYLMENGAQGGHISRDVGADMPPEEGWAKSWWSYVDVRDAAQVTWQALRFLQDKHDLHEAFNIGADDTHTTTPTAELLSCFFPTRERRFTASLDIEPYTALYSNAKARRMLGFQPTVSTWRSRET